VNNAKVTVKNAEKSGSIIDIDTYFQQDQGLDPSNIETLLEDGHLEEKTLFFKLLKDAFLQRLNPEY
jgi:uncharacterized protein (TIGR04255 family)